MFTVRQTESFHAWLRSLKDGMGQRRIVARLRQITLGNLGDHKSVGDGVAELRVNVGPGYRVYFTRRGKVLIFILVGGDKSTQTRDIERAKKMAHDLEEA